MPFNSLPREARDYIKYGEYLKLDIRYKCRNRSPWYRVPKVPASDGIFFKRSHKLPRIVNNEAGVLSTDTAYQILMKDNYKMDDLCLSFYNTITLLFSEIDGRFYSGGVLELTPKEFKGLPMLMLKSTLSKKMRFEKAFCSAPIDNNQLIKPTDNVIKKLLNMEEHQWKLVLHAHYRITSHRLRHGSKAVHTKLT